MADLTHFNARGEAHMVDISGKEATHRVAEAEGRILMQAETLEKIRQGTHRKGDVIGIARTAGIMATKRTADLVPLCHPLSLTHAAVEFEFENDPPAVRCLARCETRGPTGVEMEALTAVQVSLLTLYDMCKAVDRGMRIQDVGLLRKSGGRSGDWAHESSAS